MASRAAFFADTLSFEQWLQHVLLVRVAEIAARGGAFPESQVAVRAVRELDGDPDAEPLLDALNRFDDAVAAWRRVVVPLLEFAADVPMPAGPPPPLALETGDAVWFVRASDPPALIRLVSGRLEEIPCGGPVRALGADAFTSFWAVTVPEGQPQAGRCLPVAVRGTGAPVVVAGPADRWFAFPSGGIWTLVSEDAGVRRGFLQIGAGWIPVGLAPDGPPGPAVTFGEGWLVAGLLGEERSAAFAWLDATGAVVGLSPSPAEANSVAAVQGDRVWLWRGQETLELWAVSGSEAAKIGEWGVSSPVIAAGEGVVTVAASGGLLALAPDGRARVLRAEVPAGAALAVVRESVLWTDGRQTELLDAQTGALLAGSRFEDEAATLLCDGPWAWQGGGAALAVWSARGLLRVDLPFSGRLVSVHGEAALVHFPEEFLYALYSSRGALVGMFSAHNPALAMGIFRGGPWIWEEGRLRVR